MTPTVDAAGLAPGSYSLTPIVPGLPEGARTDDDTDIEWVYIAEMQKSGKLYVPEERIVEAIDTSHLIIAQFEGQRLEIGLDMVAARCLGNGSQTMLQMPPQANSARRLAGFFSNVFDHLVRQAFALTQR